MNININPITLSEFNILYKGGDAVVFYTRNFKYNHYTTWKGTLVSEEEIRDYKLRNSENYGIYYKEYVEGEPLTSVGYAFFNDGKIYCSFPVEKYGREEFEKMLWEG